MMADSAWMLMYLCCHSACSSRDCLTPTYMMQIALREAGHMVLKPHTSSFRTPSRWHRFTANLHAGLMKSKLQHGTQTPTSSLAIVPCRAPFALRYLSTSSSMRPLLLCLASDLSFSSSFFRLSMCYISHTLMSDFSTTLDIPITACKVTGQA